MYKFNGNTLYIKDGNDYVTVSYDDYEDIRFIVKPSVLMIYPRKKDKSRNPIFISVLNSFEWNSTLLKEQGDYAKQQIHNYFTDTMIELMWAKWSACERCGRSVKLSYPLCKTQRYLKEELMKAKLKRDLQDMVPNYVDRFRLRRNIDDIETYPDTDKFGEIGDVGALSTKKPKRTTQPPVIMEKILPKEEAIPYRPPQVYNAPPLPPMMPFPGMFPLNTKEYKGTKNHNNNDNNERYDKKTEEEDNKNEGDIEDKLNVVNKSPPPLVSYSTDFQSNLNKFKPSENDNNEQGNEVDDDDDYPDDDEDKWEDISTYTICKNVKPKTQACFRPCRKVVSPEVETNTKKTNKTIMHQMHQNMNKTKHLPQERKKLNDSDIAKTLSRLWDNQIDFQHQASLLIQKSRSHIDLILSALLVFILSIGIVLICCCIFLTTKIKRFANNPLGYLSKQYHENNRLTAPYLADKDIARTVNTLSAYKRDQEGADEEGKEVDEEHNIPEAYSSRSLTSRSLANKSLGNKSRRKINEEIMALNGISKSRSMKKFVNMEKAASSKF
ncbi:hypothetical protein SNEBB_008150 [Seison nebaliae]|nr:hypothetical protein SNEBB_008150 [Seison nebaliae]